MALAEMTGQFETKAEATITIIMRILVKMKLTNDILWQHLSTAKAADAFYKRLWVGRYFVQWLSSQKKKPGPLQGQLEIYKTDVEIYETMEKIDEMREMYSTKEDSSEFRPWDTIKLLT